MLRTASLRGAADDLLKEGGAAVGTMFAVLVAMMVVMGLIPLLSGVARRVGLVDEPDCRKHHEGCVPLVGGVAMYGGLLAGLCLLYPTPWLIFPSLIFGGLMLVFVGVVDDLLELRKRIRLPAQIVAALLMAIVGGKVLHDLGWLSFGELLTLGVLAIPFTIFCTVGVVNAVNMSDGLDGLAGGLALVTFGALAYLGYDSGATNELDVLLLLIACIAGFLAFNARSPWCKKAKVFMGDAGSMFLGFTLARFLIAFSQGDHRVMHPVIALWIFAVPLMDTIAVMLRRMMVGQSPFSADRKHLHHLLLARGFSVGQTVMTIWALAALLAVIGIGGHSYGVSDGIMFAGFIGLFGLYMCLLHYLDKGVSALPPISAETSAGAAESSRGA